MWGKHVIIDMTAGDKGSVRSADAIAKFVVELVDAIDMKAYGEPILKHFAEHVPEAAGYSLVQLIETSAITGHFCDVSGDAYIDIFSCKDFDAGAAVSVVQKFFNPDNVNSIVLSRQALPAKKLARAA
jgi:S-adenosylmethionine/arginine decarboxylase-like enzyme